jgi:hypothetical protein
MEDNRTISAVFTGFIDESTTISFTADVTQFLALDHNTYLFLMDFTGSSGMTDSAEIGLVKQIRKLHDFSLKLAVVVKGSLKIKITSIFERQSGLSSVHIYETRDEALKWLKE